MISRKTLFGRRALWAAVWVVLFALGLTAPASAETTLRMVPHADLKNTDPIWTTAYITRNHGYMVWDTLFALNEKLEPQPQMVDAWKVSPDGLTYTFTLRDGLRWSDGKAVTAEDCVASIQRWGKRDGMGQKLMDVVKSLDVVNARTFRLVLKEQYGLVLDSLGKLSSNVPFMMPKAYAETDPFQQVPKESIGSGPFIFKVDEWVPGNKVVYVRNPGYKPRSETPSLAAGGKVVKVDRVEWLYIPDQQTAVNALLTGEVDYFEQPAHDLLPLMDGKPGIRIEPLKLGEQGWLRVNHLYPPFDNIKIRQTLLWMMDQNAYMQAAIGDQRYWQTCVALFVCGTPYETQVGGEPILNHSIDKAKAMLKEAGYNGEKVVLMDPTDIPLSHNMSLVTAQLMRQIGLNVEVQAMDWSTLTSRRAKQDPPAQGGWNAFHTWWSAADVFTPLNNIGVSGGCKEKAWFGWPCDEKLEKLRGDWARATDPARKKQIAGEIQKLAYHDVTYVPTGQWFLVRALSAKLEGAIIAPVPFLWNITKK
jgi:peptide/nickel transport system substrate-binding protein